MIVPPPANISRELFLPHVGTVFQVGTPPIPMVLSTADALGAGAADRRAPFRLHFLAPPGTAAGQGTYRLRHAALPEMDLLLVPVGPAQGGMRYEAIFA